MTTRENLLEIAYQKVKDVGIIGDLPLSIIEDVIDKDIMAFGTTFDENFFSRGAFKKMIERQREQSAQLNIKWTFSPLSHRIVNEGNVAIFVDDVSAVITAGNETIDLYIRMTLVFEFIKDKWMLLHIHASKPENAESEKDTFGIDEWKQKNAELEKLVEERTKDLKKSLSDLKETQAQLIQSEKMASLGELTAGIAHEIQNPLNFVNNFSEVNKELVDELQQELKAGKIDDAIEISNDIKANEEKINHHGKRADAIVKGMLQHSRSSSGSKEPTDINALADEYLRLAYHGLRAKDKTFNATMKTDFDKSIGNVNIIPQDIGRVILNLITNAFYVVNEKKQQMKDGYEPTVTISSKKVGDKIEVSVTDNGNGIPQNIVDKIFQPFFTTKPTGQGTGLGLSLSYDIIKAHGGELKVETKENEGTTFIIQLPIT